MKIILITIFISIPALLFAQIDSIYFENNQVSELLINEEITKKLPTGVKINFKKNGIEYHVIQFIENENQPIDNVLWFDFQNLRFEVGNATLIEVTMTEIYNIYEILQAYPSVKIKIGGHTDNIDDPVANLKLSAERASAVKAALTALGIDATRVESEGYGDQYPIASNDTEEGKAQNRRIAISVREK